MHQFQAAFSWRLLYRSKLFWNPTIKGWWLVVGVLTLSLGDVRPGVLFRLKSLGERGARGAGGTSLHWGR